MDSHRLCISFLQWQIYCYYYVKRVGLVHRFLTWASSLIVLVIMRSYLASGVFSLPESATETTNNVFRDGNKKYVDAKGKGLIKGSSSKIYHLPNSQYYKSTTKPKAMFATEVQAIKAGYRPAK